MSSLPHEYNILEKAGSRLGRKHSEKTKKIMSDAKKGQNHTEETKTKMSDAQKGEKNPMYGKTGEKNPMYGKPKPKGAGKSSQQIKVTDIKNNTTILYDSMNEAARALNLPNFNIIRNYIKNNQQKPYKGKYTFKKV
jgi:group I intron endonuclease